MYCVVSTCNYGLLWDKFWLLILKEQKINHTYKVRLIN
ncbi:hypothetical protein AC062_0983 [Pasteurellaceae bacterium NI1060]|nr:hypothetical protein AC062_0983 [Pasteurellaceae bacterium NI1060]